MGGLFHNKNQTNQKGKTVLRNVKQAQGQVIYKHIRQCRGKLNNRAKQSQNWNNYICVT